MADEAHEANLEVETRLDSRSATWPFNAARRDHKHTLVASAATLQKPSDDKRTSRRIQPHGMHEPEHIGRTRKTTHDHNPNNTTFQTPRDARGQVTNHRIGEETLNTW